jgi:hypothetical protein
MTVAVAPDLFRQLLRRHAAAVVVITAPGTGFTATSFTSVSLDPPLVSFCLAKSASAWPAIEASDTVAVHVLGHDQEHVARTFATRGIDRLASHGAWREGPDGVPLLDGVLARMSGGGAGHGRRPHDRAGQPARRRAPRGRGRDPAALPRGPLLVGASRRLRVGEQRQERVGSTVRQLGGQAAPGPHGQCERPRRR